MRRCYAGIGSRSAPEDVCRSMTSIATELERRWYVLRSGHADGADIAFERGVMDQSNKEIYIPWEGFNGSPSSLYHITDEMMDIARSFHPNWGKCSQGAKKLHSRNVAQVLGEDLHSLSKFVICWTKGASGEGGTGQAIRIARHYSIPVYDLGDPVVYNSIMTRLGLV